MQKILFRTAGGKAKEQELGLGHIFRTINLSNQLQKYKKFFMIEDFGGVKKILEENGIQEIKSIKKNISSEDDYKITKTFIEKWKIDIVVVDRYKISKNYLRKLSKIVKVVVISDLVEINFKADIVVNGFIGYNNQIIKNNFNTKCLLGPKFQILNNQFSKKSKYKSKKWNLLITFGGFDERRITDRLIEILPKYLEKIKIKIIIGPVARKNKKLLALEKKFKKNLLIKKATKDMAKEMKDVKYGLCTGGLTTYEFASMNIPIGIITDEKHQIITAKNWEKLGYAKNLGMVDKISDQKIHSFFEQISQGKLLTSKKNSVVDGKGSSRVANEILKMKLEN